MHQTCGWRPNLWLVSLLTCGSSNAYAFLQTPTWGRWRTLSCLQSSIGGGGTDKPPPPPDGEGNGQWDDFFREESDNLQRAREYMSENALPINYEEATDTNSSLVRNPAFFQGASSPSAEALAKNPYLQVVSKLSPSEMISRFTSSAHPRVQNAVRSTILSLIGGLPKMAFDTTTITTGQRLASLMFQLQVSMVSAVWQIVLNVAVLQYLILQ